MRKLMLVLAAFALVALAPPEPVEAQEDVTPGVCLYATTAIPNAVNDLTPGGCLTVSYNDVSVGGWRHFNGDHTRGVDLSTRITDSMVFTAFVETDNREVEDPDGDETGEHLSNRVLGFGLAVDAYRGINVGIRARLGEDALFTQGERSRWTVAVGVPLSALVD